MTEVTAEILVHAPAEAIWPALSRVDQVHNWHPKVERSPATTTLLEGVGAGRTCHFYDGTEVKEEVVRSEHARRVDIAIVEASMPIRDAVARFELEPRGERTRVTVVMAYQTKYGPLGWLMNVLMIRPMMGRMLGQVLGGLDAHVTRGVYIGRDGAERPLLAAAG
jgi:carbon monoxide dehydrogenase subunit G